jgi:hypothetical protein
MLERQLFMSYETNWMDRITGRFIEDWKAT